MQEAYLRGVLDGDGYIYTKPEHRQVGLKVTDMDFAERFRESLIEFSSEEIPEIYIVKDKRPNRKLIYKVQSRKKSVVNKCNSIKYKNNNKNKINYLLGLFDSEGHVMFRKKNSKYKEIAIGLTTTSKRTYEKALNYFNDLRIGMNKTNKEKLPSGKIAYRIRLNSSKENVKKFNELFNPIRRKQLKIKQYMEDD